MSFLANILQYAFNHTFHSTYVFMIFMGSVLSDGWSVINKQASHEEWVNMVIKFKLVHYQPALVIPMIYGIYVHGHNNA